MPVISAAHEFITDDLYVDLAAVLSCPVYLKCEGFNFAGSVKLKAAVEMVTAAEQAGILRQGSVLVESSSGNLGVALSMIAAARGYQFVCVTDPRCNPATQRLIEAYGGRVHVVTQQDADGGFLSARIEYVRQLSADDDTYVWLNQYAHPGNWRAHYQRTAPSIAARFPGLDVLFVGAGTTGTLMGCARYFREHLPRVTIVAVDSVGSVTFGGPAAPRMISGLGTSVRPQLLDTSFVDDVVMVPEKDTIECCRRLAAQGFLFGGSTGTVVSGGVSWLDANMAADGVTAVAIAPDLGERYLETVYHDHWVQANFGSAPGLDDHRHPVAAHR